MIRFKPCPLGLPQLLRPPQDWHLASEFPSYQAYTCPAVFQDDWLNEWFDAQSRRQQDGVQGLQQAEQADGDGQQQRQGPGAGGVQVSDYRFVYLGPAVSRQQGTAGIVGLAAAPSQQPLAPTLLQGTSTPLHADVLRSYSWSANIAGRKLWRLLAPQVGASRNMMIAAASEKRLLAGTALPCCECIVPRLP